MKEWISSWILCNIVTCIKKLINPLKVLDSVTNFCNFCCNFFNETLQVSTKFTETPFKTQVVITWCHCWRQHFPEGRFNQTTGNIQISASTSRIKSKFSPMVHLIFLSIIATKVHYTDKHWQNNQNKNGLKHTNFD